MNSKKIIFAIIWIALLIWLWILFSTLNSQTAKPKTANIWDLTMWTIWENDSWYNKIIEDFKAKNKEFEKSNIVVTNFKNYNDYFESLFFSIMNSTTPDIFVLNSSESNIFDNQIIWVDPALVWVDEFRKDHEIVFSNDLIKKMTIDWKEIEYLKWIPIWYEIMWVFFNFRDLRWQKIDTWADINEAARNLKQENSTSLIWIWNWSTVYGVSDIISQFFLLEWVDNIANLTIENIKSVFSSYSRFWDKSLDNAYDNLFENLTTQNENNLNAFSKWDLQMVIGYPKMIQEIDKKWYNKTFLRASSMPTHTLNSWKLFVNYNYFVINKNTQKINFAKSFIKHLSTTEAQKIFLAENSYYFPARLSLLNDRLEESISKDYNIKYKDFYNKSLELSSFNKWYMSIYDKEIISILDKWTSWVDLFENLKKRLLCLSKKMNWEWNITVPCSF